MTGLSERCFQIARRISRRKLEQQGCQKLVITLAPLPYQLTSFYSSSVLPKIALGAAPTPAALSYLHNIRRFVNRVSSASQFQDEGGIVYRELDAYQRSSGHS